MPPSRRAGGSMEVERNLLLTVTFCLLAAGAVMVYSASSARTLLQGQGDGSTYLVRYVAYGVAGLAIMRVLSKRGVALLSAITGPLLAVSFLCLLAVKVPGLGVQVNGARRWLGAGPLQFQPSELMKLALVLHACKLLAAKPHLARTPRLLTPLLLTVACACGLILTQPDMGTALVIGITLLAILVAAGIPLRHLAIGLGVAIGLVALLAIAEPYRRARLSSFLDPWQHAGTSGFQAVQGQIALGSGGLFGRGLGESVQKAFFLPEAHTDFILAIIGEELGIVGVSALLVLYGALAYAGLRVAAGVRSAYGRLLACGLVSMILCQAGLNVFAVLGLAPLTGVPLPFISYGSTNLLVLLAAVGLLLNVAAGGAAHLQAVPTRRPQGSADARDRADRRRGDRGARRAGTGGRRRAAG